ncbi:MAG TPA: hypothetical protein VIB07_02515 [Nitrososphaera sp.]|jgi:hypothetical protein
MVHIGIDIDQFILLTIYPAAAIFGVGYLAKKTRMRPVLSYLIQAVACFVFAAVYLVAIANGGAQGLAIVLAMFGVVLLFMARKQNLQKQEQSI